MELWKINGRLATRPKGRLGIDRQRRRYQLWNPSEPR